jgi:hypothetical protein
MWGLLERAADSLRGERARREPGRASTACRLQRGSAVGAGLRLTSITRGRPPHQAARR